MANAVVVTYTDRTAFEAALSDVTTIDTSSHIGSTTFAIDDDPIYGGAFQFTGPDAYVRGDDLILNGLGFHGSIIPHVTINFASGVNGVGVTTNLFDGGRILIYDGQNASGNLLGTANFGTNGLFGGIISTDLIGSAVFTCDFNSDLKCGLRDPVYGTSANVPAPAPLVLFLFGLGCLALGRVRNR